MATIDVTVAVAATRWLDVERRWPLWSAARHRQAAIAILDQAICSLTHGAGLLTEIVEEVDPVQPRLLRPATEFCARQGRLMRDLRALSARSCMGRDADLLRRAATIVDELVRLMEQIADLQVSLRTPPGEPSRRLGHLLVDMSRRLADAWKRTRSGAAIDLQLRALARAHDHAARVSAQASAAARCDGQHRESQLATKEIVARQARAIS